MARRGEELGADTVWLADEIPGELKMAWSPRLVGLTHHDRAVCRQHFEGNASERG